MAEEINELASSQSLLPIEDLDGIGLSSVDYILATWYRVSPCTIVNSRVAQDVDGVNDGVFASGVLTLDFSPADTVLTGDHVLQLEWGYDSDSTSTLSAPFDTIATDETITVNHTAHGLSVGDWVTFVNAEETDGLNLNGVKVVTATPDLDTWEFEHPLPAVAGVTGGGGASVEYFIRPTVGREDVEYTVKAFVKAPTE